MANEEEMDEEVIDDFIETEPGKPDTDSRGSSSLAREQVGGVVSGFAENSRSRKEPAKEEKKPEVKKETSRPNEKTEAPKAKSFSVDSMVTNAVGIPRPKVELRNGREALLTRALLAEIGDYDERGTPKNNFCEEIQKVERLTKLLTLWENGVAI